MVVAIGIVLIISIASIVTKHRKTKKLTTKKSKTASQNKDSKIQVIKDYKADDNKTDNK